MPTFAELCFIAATSPDHVDRSMLLEAASHFLDNAVIGHPEGLPLARSLAAKCCDYAVFGAPAYQAFSRAFGLYCAHIDMNPQDQ